jgi:hypothetical protein
MSNRNNSTSSTADIIIDDNKAPKTTSPTDNNNNVSNEQSANTAANMVKEAGPFRYHRLERENQYSNLQVIIYFLLRVFTLLFFVQGIKKHSFFSFIFYELFFKLKPNVYKHILKFGFYL